MAVLVPLLSAAVLLALWSKQSWHRGLAALGSLTHCVITATLLGQVLRNGPMKASFGNWPAPFGIEFHADVLGASLATITAFMGLAVTVFSFHDITRERRRFGFYPLVFVLLAGLTGAFTTNDLFNLFVWFECILLSSFVLISLGGERAQLRGAINYVLPNLFSSMLFLSGLGLIYGATGTLNMDQLGARTALVEPGLMAGIAAIFLVAFSIKGALFPFFAWLPTSYHTPPHAVTALFGGLLTKVGVYAVIRFFTKIYPLQDGIFVTLLTGIAALTMIGGILGALAQKDVRRVFAFHIISQIGYMIVGLALRDGYALAASSLYMIHHILVITNLFFLAGILEHHYGTTVRAKMGGGMKKLPLLALVMVVPMASLAGLPLTSGFWPKLMLLQSGLKAQDSFLVFAMLGTSMLTLYSMAKIWNEAFLKPQDEGSRDLNISRPRLLYLPAIALTVSTVILGLFPGPFVKPSLDAAQQIAPGWSHSQPLDWPSGGDAR
jgi:multicomponent Na+:H+ antiporter subunit D